MEFHPAVARISIDHGELLPTNHLKRVQNSGQIPVQPNPGEEYNPSTGTDAIDVSPLS